MVNKTLRRNYSALNVPNKEKIDAQYLHSEFGITQKEKSDMALKLLESYARHKQIELDRERKRQQAIERETRLLIEMQ